MNILADPKHKSGETHASGGARVSARKARAPADKQARASALVDAAEAALVDGSYHDITMLEIANRAGLAKGTVYLYFPSKEALFLAVLTRKLEACFVSIEAALAAGGNDPAVIAGAITTGLLSQPALLPLMSMLHSQLEPGAGIDAVIEFKAYISRRLDEGGAAIDAAGGLPDGLGRRLILRGNALAIGLQQMTSLPKDITDEIARRLPELKGPPLSVETELTDSICDMIRAGKSSS